MRLFGFLRHMKNADRLFLFVIALLALPSLLGQFQSVPLIYRNLPFPVETPEVKAGDTVTLSVYRCNQTNDLLTYSISRVLVDVKTGSKTQLTDSSSFMPPGCETIQSKINGIPESTTTGTYRLEAVSVARVNGRSWTIPWTTQPFHVTRQ